MKIKEIKSHAGSLGSAQRRAKNFAKGLADSHRLCRDLLGQEADPAEMLRQLRTVIKPSGRGSQRRTNPRFDGGALPRHILTLQSSSQATSIHVGGGIERNLPKRKSPLLNAGAHDEPDDASTSRAHTAVITAHSLQKIKNQKIGDGSDTLKVSLVPINVLFSFATGIGMRGTNLGDMMFIMGYLSGIEIGEVVSRIRASSDAYRDPRGQLFAQYPELEAEVRAFKQRRNSFLKTSNPSQEQMAAYSNSFMVEMTEKFGSELVIVKG